VDGYRRDLKQFAEFLDGYYAATDWTWAAMDRVAIRSFLGELEARGLRRTSIRRKLSAIRAFYAFLHRTERISANPARLVRAPARERTLPGFLTEDGAAALLDGIAARAGAGGEAIELRRWALLELLYSSGLRLAEVQGLDRSAIDLRGGQVRVTGKGGIQRIVPVGRRAARAVRAYLALRAEVESDALFLSNRGSRLSRRQIQRDVTRALEGVS